LKVLDQLEGEAKQVDSRQIFSPSVRFQKDLGIVGLTIYTHGALDYFLFAELQLTWRPTPEASIILEAQAR
jgi:hypothetical protein